MPYPSGLAPDSVLVAAKQAETSPGFNDQQLHDIVVLASKKSISVAAAAAIVAPKVVASALASHTPFLTARVASKNASNPAFSEQVR